MLNIVEKYQIFFNNALLTVFEYKCSSIVSNYVENCDVEYCCKKQLNFQDLNAFRSPFTIIGKILASWCEKMVKTKNGNFLVFFEICSNFLKKVTWRAKICLFVKNQNVDKNRHFYKDTQFSKICGTNFGPRVHPLGSIVITLVRLSVFEISQRPVISFFWNFAWS